MNVLCWGWVLVLQSSDILQMRKRSQPQGCMPALLQLQWPVSRQM